MKRTYRQKQRAEAQAQTRQRIVDATIELHQLKGLAATSVADIAKCANVGKVTVYRHFPDEAALVGACSGQYFGRHPFPDIDKWQQIAEGTERLRSGLHDTYRYHRETEPMMSQVLCEARDLTIMTPYHEHWQRAADILADPWPAPASGEQVLKAALALALSFETWFLLVHKRQLSDDQAVDLMVGMVLGCAGE